MAEAIETQTHKHKRQRQWDAFFKRLVPNSEIIRMAAEKVFLGEVNGQFKVTERFNGELASRNVNAAQHVSGKFKELRADGIYGVIEPNTLLSVEHQSTHNPGMRLRFAMYREAFIEENAKKSACKWYHILLYSGNDQKEKYISEHYLIQYGYIDYLVVDINSVQWDKWGRGSLEDRVIGLCRHSENDLSRFKAVLNLIDLTLWSDANQAAMLRTAVVLASLNKDDLWEKVFEMVDIDSVLQSELDKFLDNYQMKIVERERRKAQDMVVAAHLEIIEADRNRLLLLADSFELNDLVEVLKDVDSEQYKERKDRLWVEILAGRGNHLLDELRPLARRP